MGWSAWVIRFRKRWGKPAAVATPAAPAAAPTPPQLPPHPLDRENVGESGWIQYGELQPTGGHRDFAALEQCMPALFAAMRGDLKLRPQERDFVLEPQGSDAESVRLFCYNEARHPGIREQVRLLQQHGLVVDVCRGAITRYQLTEELVHLLTKQKAPEPDDTTD